jgi:hypothetical protein
MEQPMMIKNPRTALSRVALAAAFAFAACTDTAMPGTPLGTFALSATPTTNTCGAGVGVPATWSFNIELSKDADMVYWRQNGKLVSGAIGANRTAKIETGQTSVVEYPDAGVVGCVMTRSDTVTVTLPSDSDVTSVSGTISMVFSIVTGSDCSSQLAAFGGMYDVLPCTIDLSYTAARTKAP